MSGRWRPAPSSAAGQLIFHPVLYLHRMPDRSLWPRIHDWNVRWFHELLPLAEKFDIVINLENTFDYRHLQQPGDAPVPYTTAQDMLELVYGIGSNRVQLCLDTGHAHISGQDVPGDDPCVARQSGHAASERQLRPDPAGL